MKRLLPLLFVMSSASAADWVLVGINKAAEVHVDKSSVAKEGKYRKAWTQWVYYQHQTHAKGKFNTTKTLAYFSCKERKGTITSVYHYYVGDIVSETVGDLSGAQFFDVIPDSMNEAMFKYVCEAKL